MAISSDTPIPTLNSWLPASKLKPGDYVYGPDGLPKQIKVIQDYIPTKMYAVHLSDGVIVEGDKNLAFELETFKYRLKLCDYKGTPRRWMKLRRKTVTDLLDEGLRAKMDAGRYEYSIPTTKPIQYRHEDFPVPPFIIGYWYAGQTRKSRIRCKPDNIKAMQEKLKDYGYTSKPSRNTWLNLVPDITKQLKLHYLILPRTIPIEYFFGSVEQRLELLRGIMLTRATPYDVSTDVFTYKTRRRGFAVLLRGLLESLGITNSMKFNKVSLTYEVRFRTSFDLLVERNKKRGVSRFGRRFVRKIEEIESRHCVHIEADGTFLAGEGYVAIC